MPEMQKNQPGNEFYGGKQQTGDIAVPPIMDVAEAMSQMREINWVYRGGS